MIYPMFSIRDQKVGFLAPTVEQNDESAKRNFSMMINSGNGLPGYAPGDFDFYKVGEFDSEKGVIKRIYPIELVFNGLDVFVKKDEK